MSYIPRLTFYCLAFLFSTSLLAQEICDNGVDDDGDGLVDIQDTTDCSCSIEPNVESIFPNPSFEDFAPGEEGCTSSQTGGLPDGPGQVDCLKGWIRASDGTTDSWNAFTYSGNPPFWPAAIPQPLPSGSGVAGFWSGVTSPEDYGSDGRQLVFLREYLGACLKDGGGMIAGEAYRLTLNIGYAEESFYAASQSPIAPGDSGRVSSPPIAPLALYGIRSCADIRFEGRSCVENSDAPGWEKITDFDVIGTPGSWTAATVDFVPNNAYEAIAIGANCDDNLRENRPEWRHYYFVDDIRINTEEAFTSAGFVPGPISVQGESICDDNIVLTGSEADGATFQWYKDGVAIVGATDRSYRVLPGLDIDGAYTLRTTVAAGCALSDPVAIQRPIIPESVIKDSFQLCRVGRPIAIRASSNFAATYTWDDGSTERIYSVSQPGDYSVTINTPCEIKVEEYAVVLDGQPSFDVNITGQDCYDPENPTTFTLTTDWELGFVIVYNDFENGSNDFLGVIGNDPLRLSSLASPLLRFEANTDCGETVTVLVDLRDNEPSFEAAIVPLSCRETEGSITLTPDPTASPATYQWRDPSGAEIPRATGLTLFVDEPGAYTLVSTSTEGCESERAFEVTSTDVDIDFIADVPTLSCATPSAELSVTTSELTAITYQWFGPDGLLIAGAAGPVITVAEPGSYRLLTNYGVACTQEETYLVPFEEIEVAFTSNDVSVSCLAPEALLEVATTYPAPLTYAWRDPAGQLLPGETGLALTVTRSGEYTLLYTFTSGCTQEANFTVRQEDRQVNFTPAIPQLSCETPTGQLSVRTDFTEPATYQWLDGTGAAIPGATNLMLSVTAPGAYRLEATLAGGCVEGETFVVPYTDNFRVEIEVESSPCEDVHTLQATPAQGSAPYSYLWQDSFGTVFSFPDRVTDLPSGEYSLTVVDASGCQDETSIAVDTVIGLRLDSVIPIANCEEVGGILSTSVSGGAGPFRYGLPGQPGSLDSDVAVAATGDYIVAVTDANGCTVTSDPVALVRPTEFEIEVGEDRLIKIGEQFAITTRFAPPADLIPGLALNWQSSRDTLSCTTCPNPVALPVDQTTYILTATSSEGCIERDTVRVDVDKRAPAFFPTAFSPNADGVNDLYQVFPSLGYTNLEYLRIYNRWGALCYEFDPTSPGWDGKISGEPALIGTYSYIGGLRRLDGRLVEFAGTIALMR